MCSCNASSRSVFVSVQPNVLKLHHGCQGASVQESHGDTHDAMRAIRGNKAALVRSSSLRTPSHNALRSYHHQHQPRARLIEEKLESPFSWRKVGNRRTNLEISTKTVQHFGHGEKQKKKKQWVAKNAKTSTLEVMADVVWLLAFYRAREWWCVEKSELKIKSNKPLPSSRSLTEWK